jgi:hypothetical protein
VPSANPCRWTPMCWMGGKQLTMVMMFVGGGGVVLVLDGILVLFLPYKTYGAGVFRSRPNPWGLILKNIRCYLLPLPQSTQVFSSVGLFV